MPRNNSRDAYSGTNLGSRAGQNIKQNYNQRSDGLDVRKNNTVDFINRFKGKLSKMTKEGHIGVAKTTNAPIEKNASIIIDQQTLNSSPLREYP